jgi:hypothetical protein
MSFYANPNFDRELAATLAVKAELVAAASRARPIVEGMTHHAMPRPGHQRIEVQEAEGDIYLVNTNYGGHLEEWGGADVKSPVYSPLRRGVRAAGFPLVTED